MEVEGPGGVIVEFPDGTAPDVISGAMRKHFGAPAPTAQDTTVRPPISGSEGDIPSTAAAAAPTAAPAPAAPSGPLPPSIMQQLFPRYGIAAGLANGMTFGALPNIEGAVAAGIQGAKNLVGAGDGTSAGDAYDKTLKETQDARRAFHQDAPFIAPAADAAGGLATGGALVRNGVTAIGRMANNGLSNLIPRMFVSGAEGAGYGAAAGAGGSEGGLSDRLQAAKDNAPIGALFGTAAVPAIDYIAKPVGQVASNIYKSFRDPEGQGRDMLVRSIMRDKGNPNALASSVEDAANAGQPDYRAIDAAGRNTQKLGKMAARTPGEFRNEAPQILDARQGGAADRIGGYVDEATGAVGPNARQIERGITQGRATAANDLYEQAYNAPTPQGAVYDEMMQRPSVQQAIGTLERTAAERQMPLSDVMVEIPNPNARTVQTQVPTSVLGPDGQPIMRTQTTVENPTIRVPTMRGWDMVKRSLDAQVDAGYRSTDAAQRTAAGATRETRDALRNQLGEDNPAYRDALARYSDDSAALDAVQTGRDLVKSPSDATREAFDQVAPGQSDLGRIGAAAEIRNKLNNKRSGQDATQDFDSNNARQTLDQIAVDPVAREVLGNAGSTATRSGRLGREQDMAATRRMMAGGSDTAENLADQTPPGLLQGLGLMVSGHPVRGAGMLGEVLRRAGSGMNERSARTVGDYLMSNEPDTIRQLADLFVQQQAAAAAPSVAAPRLSAAFEAPRQRSDRR